MEQTKNRGSHGRWVAGDKFLFNAGKLHRLGDKFLNRPHQRRRYIPSTGRDHREHSLPVVGPYPGRSQIGRQYDTHLDVDISDRRYCPSAVVDDDQHLAIALTYPKVNQEFAIHKIQAERPFTKNLDRRVRLKSNPLFKRSLAKALQAPTHLQTAGLDDAGAGGPGTGNGSLESC